MAVARALVSRPAVVFADEPTGNLDSASGRQILSLLRRTVDELGQTIVMVTHDAESRPPWPTGCSSSLTAGSSTGSTTPRSSRSSTS